MRTTLTLDDDLAERLEELARQRNVSLEQVVNHVIRRGLLSRERLAEERAPFPVKTFDSAFQPGVDPLRLRQLVDDLEIRRSDHGA